ncbi:MAG: hypothetical protein M1823_006458, partial [Watsoniomyces obsoletus]
MAERPSETSTFTNNPDIAAEIAQEKTENLADNSSSVSDNTQAEQDDGTTTNKEANGAKLDLPGTHDKIEITEEDFYDELGYGYPTWKKWMIITIVFLVQVSMNFNTSLYSNALHGISEEFGVSMQAARCGAMIFLVFYAFGCELWAPWSEEFGRKPILQASLFLVNIWQLPVAMPPNFATILIGRALGGLSTAGGSVTLGMVADMWNADDQ